MVDERSLRDGDSGGWRVDGVDQTGVGLGWGVGVAVGDGDVGVEPAGLFGAGVDWGARGGSDAAS